MIERDKDVRMKQILDTGISRELLAEYAWSLELGCDMLRASVGASQENNARLMKQNKELRELMCHMLTCLDHTLHTNEVVDFHCDTCKLDNMEGRCAFFTRARKLGVEVDE